MSNYSCTGCPTSCSVIVEEVNGEYKVTGNDCYTGSILAIEEYKKSTTPLSDMGEVKE